jgi:predicted XRE-type DNA-binding protein
MPKSKRFEPETEPSFEVGSGKILKDMGFPEEQAVNMFARGQLALAIRGIVEKNGWTQRRAAVEIGVPQPRISEIMKMRIEHYSVDMLLKYLDKLGWQVSFVLKKKNKIA